MLPEQAFLMRQIISFALSAQPGSKQRSAISVFYIAPRRMEVMRLRLGTITHFEMMRRGRMTFYCVALLYYCTDKRSGPHIIQLSIQRSSQRCWYASRIMIYSQAHPRSSVSEKCIPHFHTRCVHSPYQK